MQILPTTGNLFPSMSTSAPCNFRGHPSPYPIGMVPIHSLLFVLNSAPYPTASPSPISFTWTNLLCKDKACFKSFSFSFFTSVDGYKQYIEFSILILLYIYFLNLLYDSMFYIIY